MQEIVVPILTFLGVVFIGGAMVIAGTAEKKRLQARLEYGTAREVKRRLGFAGLMRLFYRVGGMATSSNYSQVLQKNLTRAGFHDKRAPAVYIGAKMILLLAGFPPLLLVLASASLALATKAVLVLIGAMILFFAPNVIVYACRRKRRTEILHHLPDAVDLLEICVSSGMGMEMAWNMVSEEIRRVSRDLADEMALTNLEIHLGASRVAAMRDMARRTGAEELGSLVAVLVQSERFGTSIADALRTFASSMREGRSALAEERAEKTAVKLLFPMVLLIFPVMLIVVVGPASIRFAELIRAG